MINRLSSEINEISKVNDLSLDSDDMELEVKLVCTRKRCRTQSSLSDGSLGGREGSEVRGATLFETEETSSSFRAIITEPGTGHFSAVPGAIHGASTLMQGKVLASESSVGDRVEAGHSGGSMFLT